MAKVNDIPRPAWMAKKSKLTNDEIKRFVAENLDSTYSILARHLRQWGVMNVRGKEIRTARIKRFLDELSAPKPTPPGGGKGKARTATKKGTTRGSGVGIVKSRRSGKGGASVATESAEAKSAPVASLPLTREPRRGPVRMVSRDEWERLPTTVRDAVIDRLADRLIGGGNR